MLVLHERSFVGATLVEVRLYDDLAYLLRYGDLVVYENNVRTVRGKKAPYALRSVEQLRYDFERDVAAAGGRLA